MKTKVNTQKIKELREQRGWSQSQLSEMAGISLRTLQRMEKEENSSIESVKSIASVFEIDFQNLLLEEDSKKFEGINFLKRIEHGKEIIDILGNKHASSFDYEFTITDANLITLIHELFQNVQDYNDIWDVVEYGSRTDAILTFQQLLDELTKNDLWVFGGISKQPYGNYDPPLIFDVIILRIHKKGSEAIINVDLDNPNVSAKSQMNDS